MDVMPDNNIECLSSLISYLKVILFLKYAACGIFVAKHSEARVIAMKD